MASAILGAKKSSIPERVLAWLRRDNAQFLAQFRDNLGSADPGFSLSVLAYMAAGDYVEIVVFHNAGVTLLQRTEAGQRAYMAISKVAASSNSGAQLSSANLFTAAQRVQPVALSISSGVVAINCALSNIFTLSLTANVTSITLSNLAAGTQFSIHITQDGTGGRTVSGWPASVRWAGGVAPTITSTANVTDIITFESSNGTTLRGSYAQNFPA